MIKHLDKVLLIMTEDQYHNQATKCLNFNFYKLVNAFSQECIRLSIIIGWKGLLCAAGDSILWNVVIIVVLYSYDTALDNGYHVLFLHSDHCCTCFCSLAQFPFSHHYIIIYPLLTHTSSLHYLLVSYCFTPAAKELILTTEGAPGYETFSVRKFSEYEHYVSFPSLWDWR